MAKRTQNNRFILERPQGRLSFIWMAAIILLLFTLGLALGPDNYSMWLTQ